MLAFQSLFYNSSAWLLLSITHFVSACLKISACLFWSPSASRLHPACSVSGNAQEPLFFLYPSLSQACYISACESLALIWLTKKKNIFLTSGHEMREAQLWHPLDTSVAEQHLRSLLHGACPALIPLVSSSGSAAAGLSPLLLQEVTALTV